MEKQLVKEVKEQEVPMFEYNSAVNELIKLSKAEKERLDHEIVLARGRAKEIREENIRNQAQFSQWKIAEEQKFKNELSKRHNQLIDQENKMNIFHKDLQQRSADLLVKEERYLKVDEERKKLANDRIDIERIRVAAHNLMAEADRKISDARSAMSQANEFISKSKDLDNKNAIRNQELCVREDKLAFDLKGMEAERKHLTELREAVEPKIIELNTIQEQIARDKKEISDKHQETMVKNEENTIAFKALEDKKAKLDRLENELRSKEDEIKRKILIADTKKAS